MIDSRILSERQDILGPSWTARTLAMRPDSEGKVVATLVHRRTSEKSRRAVLYLHGFVDYFFQDHAAQVWLDQGFDFYALDLRKYGRSLLPGQTPNFCRSLTEYREELDLSARIIRELDDHNELVLLGHSTGGLIASLWANARADRGIIDALVLNSPWFDLNGNWFERTVGSDAVRALGRVAPKVPIRNLSPHYGHSLHKRSDGEWDYDLAWKPIDGFPARAGFIRAVRRGHEQLARGLEIDVPALVCCSARSGPDDRWSPALLDSDCVLDVNQIVRRSVGLGPDVTVLRIDGGVHDLALSSPVPRKAYFDGVHDWISDRLG